MKVSYEPGDGSFEVILSAEEILPDAWNRPDTRVFREVVPNHFIEEPTLRKRTTNDRNN